MQMSFFHCFDVDVIQISLDRTNYEEDCSSRDHAAILHVKKCIVKYRVYIINTDTIRKKEFQYNTGSKIYILYSWRLFVRYRHFFSLHGREERVTYDGNQRLLVHLFPKESFSAVKHHLGNLVG